MIHKIYTGNYNESYLFTKLIIGKKFSGSFSINKYGEQIALSNAKQLEKFINKRLQTTLAKDFKKLVFDFENFKKDLIKSTKPKYYTKKGIL